MAYRRDTLKGLTPVQRRRWARRAETIHSRAEALLSDAIKALGVEHPLTDEIDNVMATAEDLCDALRPEGI